MWGDCRLNIAIYAEIHFEGSDMNKTEFVAAVAETAGASKKDAENIINATLAQIEKVLVAGGKVQFVGFGTFETRERGERTAKNPQTGAEITIPASKAPAFKAGKALSRMPSISKQNYKAKGTAIISMAVPF